MADWSIVSQFFSFFRTTISLYNLPCFDVRCLRIKSDWAFLFDQGSCHSSGLKTNMVSKICKCKQYVLLMCIGDIRSMETLGALLETETHQLEWLLGVPLIAMGARNTRHH